MREIDIENYGIAWLLVDMHLGLYGTLPGDENDKGKGKYKDRKELALLYKEGVGKDMGKSITENFNGDNNKTFSLYYTANRILENNQK